jgi:hypothetical protein
LRVMLGHMVVKIDHCQRGEGGREGEGEGQRKVFVDHGVRDHHEGTDNSAPDKGGHPGVFSRVQGGMEDIPGRVGH